MSEITCLNCGEAGHMVKDCKKPIDRKAIAENKRKIFRNQDTRRVPGGGGNGQNGGDSKKIVNKRRIPPGPGEPKEKVFDGKTLKWCGKCGLWTYHSTEEHKTKAELDAEKSKTGISFNANTSTNEGSYAGATALNF